MKTTLGEAKTAIDIREATGIPSCDARFVSLLNNAQRYLADFGKWWGTYRRLYVCVNGGCITWPAGVANVESLHLDGTGVAILNLWYEFQNYVATPDPTTVSCGESLLIDRPTTPLHTDSPIAGKIRLYPSSSTDIGKRVLLQGIDSATGRTIRTQDGSVHVDGEYVTLAIPFVTSTFTFAMPGPTAVQKPLTNGLISAYSVHAGTGVENLIAEWGPSERNPDYRRSFSLNYPTSTNTCMSEANGCSTVPSCAGVVAEAIVRMEVVPAAVDSDWLLIPNLNALRHGMVALQMQSKSKYQEGEIETQQALRILRAELQKYSPKSTMRVNVMPHGTADPRRAFAGFR